MVVLTCFVICWCVCVCVCVYVCGYFDSGVNVLVICVLVFTVFCIICSGLFYCFVYVYLFLFVSSVRTTATE